MISYSCSGTISQHKLDNFTKHFTSLSFIIWSMLVSMKWENKKNLGLLITWHPWGMRTRVSGWAWDEWPRIWRKPCRGWDVGTAVANQGEASRLLLYTAQVSQVLAGPPFALHLAPPSSLHGACGCMKEISKFNNNLSTSTLHNKGRSLRSSTTI